MLPAMRCSQITKDLLRDNQSLNDPEARAPRNDTLREILLYRSRKGKRLRKLKFAILSPPCVRA